MSLTVNQIGPDRLRGCARFNLRLVNRVTGAVEVECEGGDCSEHLTLPLRWALSWIATHAREHVYAGALVRMEGNDAVTLLDAS